MKLNNAFSQVRSTRATPKGNAGYDNIRDNIDPHVKTKVLSSKEGTIEKVPVNNSDIANKKYVDDEISNIDLSIYLQNNENIAMASYNLTINNIDANGYANINGVLYALGGCEVTGDLDVSGDIEANNLSGTNTGDQNLSGYAELSGADFSGYVDFLKRIRIRETGTPEDGVTMWFGTMTDPKNTSVSAGYIQMSNAYRRLFFGTPSTGISRLDFGYVGTIDNMPSLFLLEKTRGAFTVTYISTNQGKSHLALISQAAYGWISGEVSSSSPAGHRSLNYKTYSDENDRYFVDAQYVYDTYYGKSVWNTDQLHSVWRENGNDLMSLDKDGNLKITKNLISATKTPSSATDTGTAGTICWDSNYIYICTATDTWKRVAISSW